MTKAILFISNSSNELLWMRNNLWLRPKVDLEWTDKKLNCNVLKKIIKIKDSEWKNKFSNTSVDKIKQRLQKWNKRTYKNYEMNGKGLIKIKG